MYMCDFKVTQQIDYAMTVLTTLCMYVGANQRCERLNFAPHMCVRVATDVVA